MKVLIVGDWHSELHEEAVYGALAKLGHEPLRFAWCQYFQPVGLAGKLGMPLLKAQDKYMVGPLVDRLNRDLAEKIELEQPDLIFVYRGTHVYAATLRRMRIVAPRAILVGYNNDDPFSPQYPKWKWRHFLAGVPEYDLVLAYRLHNIEEFKAAGANRVELLRSWYIPERNHPVELTEAERQCYECDVVFVGHYEDDGRLECLENIIRCGWSLRIFGHGDGWHPVIKKSKYLKHLYPLRTVWGEDYNKALAGAKIALCFFSKLNRDTYTRRCFEIPASGTMLLSEHSDDLAGLFAPGVDADYFKNKNELVEKVDWYLRNRAVIKSISNSGMKKVLAEGHDVCSRISSVLDMVKSR